MGTILIYSLFLSRAKSLSKVSEKVALHQYYEKHINMDHLSFGSLGLGVPSSPNTSKVNETAPQLIHQSAKSTIYRLKERGIKVSLDPDPTQEELIRKLLHEQNISKVSALGWATHHNICDACLSCFTYLIQFNNGILTIATRLTHPILTCFGI